MSDIIVRRAQPEDLSGIAEVERESAATPWTLEQLSTEFENEFAYLFCAEADGEIAGLCDIHIAYGDAHINEVAVSARHRRKGVASALIGEAVKATKQHGCAAVTLEVRSSSREARAFYDTQGFRMIGQKWGFYSDPTDDALVLQKEI